jgi:hypothetical protein
MIESDVRFFLESSGSGPNPALTILNENLGETNKGLGELSMLERGFLEHKDTVLKSATVSYFTGRRLMTNHYLIERTEGLKKSALLSNPNFVGLDGEFTESSLVADLYNDMFFSMKVPVLLDYLNYFRQGLERFQAKGVGSEQILYSFVTENQIEFEFLMTLGLIRRVKGRTKGSILRRQRWDVI